MVHRTLFLACALTFIAAGGARAQSGTPQSSGQDSNSSSTPQQSQGGSGIADTACHAGCEVVNALDQTVSGTPIQPFTQPTINEARDAVNKACTDNCPKPPARGAARGSKQ